MNEKLVKDLSGKQFGKLTVLRRAENLRKSNGQIRTQWLCRCGCAGVELIVPSYLLLAGKRKSCGCLRKEQSLYQIIHLSGKRFGSLVVLEFDKLVHGKGAIWKCKCDCGNFASFYGTKLIDETYTYCKNKIHREYPIGKRSKAYKGYNGINGSYWSVVKRNAKDRNIKLELSIKAAWELYEQQNQKCAFGGMLITMGAVGRVEQFASLDRIDSSESYTIDNVQWVHKDLNIMKQSLTNELFISSMTCIAYPKPVCTHTINVTTKNIDKNRWTNHRRKARQASIEFSINRQYMIDLYIKQSGLCAVSRIPIALGKGNASIDRIDSSKGYVPGNVQWVDLTVNCIKRDHSMEKLKYLAKQVADYQTTKWMCE